MEHQILKKSLDMMMESREFSDHEFLREEDFIRPAMYPRHFQTSQGSGFTKCSHKYSKTTHTSQPQTRGFGQLNLRNVYLKEVHFFFTLGLMKAYNMAMFNVQCQRT